jgi:UDP-N-acetylmuramoyl-tripeptide--D-alanyl-D-alanine ligase
MFEINQIVKATGGKLYNTVDSAVFSGLSTDSRSIKEGEIFLAIRGENFDGHNFISEVVNKGAGCIIAEDFNPTVLRGVPAIKVDNSITALGDIARAHRGKFNIPVIAVTGSNGKTTTKEMIAWVLSGKSKVLSNEGTKNNHIGVPMTLLRLDESYQIAVLELGTNHFGEIDYLAGMVEPSAQAITNIGESHLEHFKDLAGVYKEKSSLYKRVCSRIILLNNDDRFLRKDIQKKRIYYRDPFIFGFGIKGRTDFRAKEIKIKEAKVEFKCSGHRYILDTLGVCNVYNALIAIAFGRIFGMGHSEISERLMSFKFPKGRLNLINHNNTRYIDDTYNSNPFSLTQALDALAKFKVKGRKMLVMGDMLELGNKSKDLHKKSGRSAAKICDVLITVGKLAKSAALAAKKSGLAPKSIFSCDSSIEAAKVLFEKFSPGPEDIVLVKGSRSMKMEEVFKTDAL